MCGIFGLVFNSNNLDIDLKDSLIKLIKLSERRGKDSSGIIFYNNNKINSFKSSTRASSLIKKKNISSILNESFKFDNYDGSKLIFGHARLATDGDRNNPDNNQPVFRKNIFTVHNGIIVNNKDLFKKYKNNFKKKLEIDTELVPLLINFYLENGFSIKNSFKKLYKNIKGAASLAVLIPEYKKIILTSNFGSLYILRINNDITFFSSDKWSLEVISRKIKKQFSVKIFQIKSKDILEIDLSDNLFKLSQLKNDNNKEINLQKNKVEITNEIIEINKNKIPVVIDLNQIHLLSGATSEKKLLKYNIDKIKNLKRCTRCILPETFPFINFDSKGVCNYCNNHTKKINNFNKNKLLSIVEKYRKNNGKADCLVPLSGGRDSIFTLHYVKNELNMNPIAFTYDWGMVTDLARRNIARICGQLEVENIIVAADIQWKRDNIRKNILAWLKNPELGMIPLFMAGDKYFFYYFNLIKKQTDIDLNIWGINNLENTDFKTGFAGIEPRFDKKRIYSLSLTDQIKLFSYVGKNFVKSPSYINQSIFDSLGSIFSRYFNPKKDYYHLFDYVKWNESQIENIILSKYDFEKSFDTSSTWRIGDGTASFYNYVYCLVSGFTEHDTFRSNQIREGMITREKALSIIYDENRPRYNSIKWYLSIIGLDYKTVINNVNKINPKF